MNFKFIKTTLLAVGLTALITGCSFSGLISKDNGVNTHANNTETACNTLAYKTLTKDQQIAYDCLLTGLQKYGTKIEVYGSERDVMEAYNAILADRPEVFYISGYVYDAQVSMIKKEETGICNIYPNYIYSETEVTSFMEQIDETVDEWLRGISADASDYEKSKFVFEKIVKNNTYKKDAPYNQTMISAFLYGDTVCGGYSQAYTYALQRIGIPCATITGTLDGISHSWNIAYLDKDLYMSDLTNGDSSYINSKNSTIDYINYSYFNMNPNHVGSYKPDASYEGIRVSAMADNYYVRESKYFTNYNPELLGNVIMGAFENGEDILTLSFESTAVLNEAIENFFESGGMGNYIDAETINYMTSAKFNTLTLFLSEMSPKVSKKTADAVINAKTAAEFYALIPVNIRTSFEATDWTWNVYEKGSLADAFGYKTHIMGLTLWNEHRIWIDRDDYSSSAIVHEIGHWAGHFYNSGYDRMMLEQTYKTDWEKLYSSFGGSIKNYNSAEEFSASAFECYVLEPEKLYAAAPGTYKLVDSLVNDTGTVTTAGVSEGKRISVLGNNEMLIEVKGTY